MNISRNEVSAFQYSSSMDTTAEDIVTPHGTVSAGVLKTVFITDLKATVGSTARTIKIYGENGNKQALEFDLPGNSNLDFHWELPYELDSVSATAAIYGIVSSASGADVKYTISGYYG